MTLSVREQLDAYEDLLAEVLLEEQRDLMEYVLSYRLKETNELSGMGYIYSGILHDLGTPLTITALNLEELKSKYGNDEHLELAMAGVDKMRDLLQNFRTYTANQHLRTAFNIFDEFSASLKLINYRLDKHNISVKINWGLGLRKSMAHGSRTKFSQLLLNLVANSIDALKESSKAAKRIHISFEKDPAFYLLSISDNAEGIAPEDQLRIFSPLYTTKRDGGMGLGLYICKQIAEADFNGEISFTTQVGQGSTFTFRWPIKG